MEMEEKAIEGVREGWREGDGWREGGREGRELTKDEGNRANNVEIGNRKSQTLQ